MEYSASQTVEGTQTVSETVKKPSLERNVLIILGLEFLMIFLALVESYYLDDLQKTYKPGLFNNGIPTLFSELSSGKFFSNGDKVEIFIQATIYGVLNFILVLIAIYAREKNWAQRGVFVTTILFGITLTQLTKLATSNYIFMFVTFTFVPAFYWYYTKYGEVRSFFENRVIIFSIRRSIAIIPMFLAISLFTFFAMNFVGDPVGIATNRVQYGRKELQAELLFRFGLEDRAGNPIPAWKRYLAWVYEFMHGDFGESYEQYPLPVTDGIGFKLFLTLKLQLVGLFAAFFLCVIIGILAAYFHKTPADAGISAIALLGLSMPIFVSGILAILIFGGTGLDWFPTFGANFAPEIMVQGPCGQDCGRDPKTIWADDFTSKSIFNRPWLDFAWWGVLFRVMWYYFLDGLNHLILPALTLTFATMAVFARLTRGTMLEIMRQDYILAARANGWGWMLCRLMIQFTLM